MIKRDSRILIAGLEGLIGRVLADYFKREGFKGLMLVESSGVDMSDQKAVLNLFKDSRPEYCFLAHVKEGGIGANTKYPAELMYQNLIAQTNMIHCAYMSSVKRLIYFASSCVYPKDCPQPMVEEQVLTGQLEQSSQSYALAKIAGIKMCEAYNKQYGTDFLAVIPATVYGPNDRYDEEDSHVLPSLIMKFHQAKTDKKPEVAIWGTGAPRREFIYADDLANACVSLAGGDIGFKVINIGTGTDIAIRDLAELIKKIVGYEGKIVFDSSRPDGPLRKLLNNDKIRKSGWEASVPLEEGIRKAYDWYRQNTKMAAPTK